MEKKLTIKNISTKNNNSSKNAICIYGEINSYENSCEELKACLDNFDVNEPLTVYINSFGGEVSNGISMYNQLKEYKDLTVIVDGVCMSIATVIAMASNKIVMKKGTLFMIHKPLTYTVGNADDLKKDIEMLDKVEESILDIYKKFSALDREALSEFMKEEKFLSAEEAKEIFTNIVLEDEEREFTNSASQDSNLFDEAEKFRLELEIL